MKKTLFLLAAACGSLLYGCGGSSAPPSPPLITTVSLSDGTIGAAYTQSIHATGGTAPFKWSVSSGSLPHALTLSSSSSSSLTISGTPDTVQANVALSIQVCDVNGQTASQPFSISIKGTTAQTQSGAVQGDLAGDVLGFRGIQYAAPPNGDRARHP